MNRTNIENALIEMGIPAKLKGFTYITDAIECIEKNGECTSMMRCLYADVAKKNKTTLLCTERAIRHAFDVARSERGDYEAVNHYIGFANCENSSSLKMLHKRIRQECRKEEEEETKREEEKKIDSEEIRKIIREEISAFFKNLSGEET